MSRRGNANACPCCCLTLAFSKHNRCRPGQASVRRNAPPRASAEPGPITTGRCRAKEDVTTISRNDSRLWLWVPAFAGTTPSIGTTLSVCGDTSVSGDVVRTGQQPALQKRMASLLLDIQVFKHNRCRPGQASARRNAPPRASAEPGPITTGRCRAKDDVTTVSRNDSRRWLWSPLSRGRHRVC
jgi:hypothetical protein